MIRTLLLSFAAAGLSGQASLPPPPPIPVIEAPAASNIQFTVTRRTSDAHAQLSLTYGDDQEHGRSQTSGPEPWAELVGLTPADLDRTPPGAVVFRLERPAGVVACSGVAGGGAATGGCRFDADEAFANALASRVGERPDERQLFQLALSDFNMDVLDELDRQDYARPDLNEVVAMGIHGVDADYVRGIAGSGYRLGSVDDLVAFHIHGVTPQYIAAIAALGPNFVRMPPRQLMALSIHGVTPEYAREMAALGYAEEQPDRLVGMRIHGVTPELVRELAAAGYGDLPVDELMAFAIHDVTPDYIQGMAVAGYQNLSAERLISLRIHGVTPDYARAMEAEGVAEEGTRPPARRRPS